MTEFPTEPVSIILSDGVERTVRFSMGSLRRLKKTLKKDTSLDVLNAISADTIPEFLMEGLVDKAGVADTDAMADLIEVRQLPYLIGRLSLALSESVPAADLKQPDAEEKNEQSGQPVN
jgi:hypothetical protein